MVASLYFVLKYCGVDYTLGGSSIHFAAMVIGDRTTLNGLIYFDSATCGVDNGVRLKRRYKQMIGELIPNMNIPIPGDGALI